MKRWTWTSSLALLGLGAGAMGCAGYGTFCEDEMDCRGGNDNDVEACVVLLDAESDHAGVHECTDQWDELFACMEEESHCEDRHWTTLYGNDDACHPESEDYDACMR